MIRLDDNWSQVEATDSADTIPWYSYRLTLICNHCGAAIGHKFVPLHEAWHWRVG